MISGLICEVKAKLEPVEMLSCKYLFNKFLEESSKPTKGSSKTIKSAGAARTRIKASFICCPKDMLAEN